MEEKKNDRKNWSRKLRNKYKLVILNDETYEERFAFRLSRLNVFISTGLLAIALITGTTLLIAFTPLREYIPGYTDLSLYSRIDDLTFKADSLEKEFDRRNLYIYNLQMILEGRDTVAEIPAFPDTLAGYEDITIAPSREDSLLRAEFEQQTMYNIFLREEEDRPLQSSIRGFNFFSPLNGFITNAFNPGRNHFGVDIVAPDDEAVKATLDGVVVFADWTLETGYTIGVQHEDNLFSVYKHNASLLKKEGERVKAGDPISIVGSSGELTTGPHLHFELWFNGRPVNPADLMIF